jgi:hypothetical protein
MSVPERRKPRKARTRAQVEASRRLFLDAYAKTGSVVRAAKLARLSSPARHSDWLKTVAGYAEEFAQAHAAAVDALEREARRRAVEGVNEPVFYKGQICGHVRKYSDHLLMFLLRAAVPSKYRERITAEVSGVDGGPIQVELSAALQKVYGAASAVITLPEDQNASESNLTAKALPSCTDSEPRNMPPDDGVRNGPENGTSENDRA